MQVIKKKIGKKEYFYLKYSYRKNSKVITKEKYLGEKIPENIESIKNELKKETKSILYEKLKKIKENFQKDWKRHPKKIKQKELEEIALAFTYNTNAIEGSTITLEEVREIIEEKIAPHKPIRDIKETEAHYEVFINMLEKKEKITNSLILRWHKEIFEETGPEFAGKYRDYLVRVGNYLAPDWQDVKKLMDELINFIEKSKLNPVELAAISHYRFEKIHPFGDGNGRVGRFLINYILWHAGYPMIIIEYKRRQSYYKAFKKDEDRFLTYFIRRYLSVHNKRIR